MPITYLFRLISFKNKKKCKGLGGFFFKEFFFIKVYDFFLVILFFNKKITEKEIKEKLSIIKSMNIILMLN